MPPRSRTRARNTSDDATGTTTPADEASQTEQATPPATSDANAADQAADASHDPASDPAAYTATASAPTGPTAPAHPQWRDAEGNTDWDAVADEAMRREVRLGETILVRIGPGDVAQIARRRGALGVVGGAVVGIGDLYPALVTRVIGTAELNDETEDVVNAHVMLDGTDDHWVTHAVHGDTWWYVDELNTDDVYALTEGIPS